MTWRLSEGYFSFHYIHTITGANWGSSRSETAAMCKVIIFVKWVWWAVKIFWACLKLYINLTLKLYRSFWGERFRLFKHNVLLPPPLKCSAQLPLSILSIICCLVIWLTAPVVHHQPENICHMFRDSRWSDQQITNSPSLSESESARGGMRTRIWRWSLWTTSCSFPLDLSMSFPASCRERFSVTVPLIYARKHTHKHTQSQRLWELRLRCKAHELFSVCLVLSHHIKGCGSEQNLFFILVYTVTTTSSSKQLKSSVWRLLYLYIINSMLVWISEPITSIASVLFHSFLTTCVSRIGWFIPVERTPTYWSTAEAKGRITLRRPLTLTSSQTYV